MNRIDKLSVGKNLLWVNDPYDIMYLTGQDVSKGLLLIHEKQQRFFVDKRYLEVCQRDAEVDTEEESEENIKRFLRALTFDALLFDPKKMTYADFLVMKQFCKEHEVQSSNIVSLARMCKDRKEIDLMKKSAELTKEGLDHIVSFLKVGVTERAVAWEFEKFCRERGASKMAFSPIVAFGPNTSLPHYKTGEASLKKGDPVLFDVGIAFDHYTSDTTRSFLFKGKNKNYDYLKNLVLEAHQIGLSLCKPGAYIKEIDETIHTFFRENGVENLYKHSLGHSLGLEVHEYPTISIKADPKACLKERMVVTIEPGLYVEGQFGYRHEDTIVITSRGYKNFYD